LKTNKIAIGDSVKIFADITYSGIIMPRYEHSDDKHIVLKLKSGYNIGLEINKIEKIEKKPTIEKIIEKNQEIKKKH
jgi:glutamyl-tRNA(Gln) amidotransferase subunit D